ncbi:DUF3025 domain-containing protein [Xylophilus sp. Kf1]|nr:DUF3025 domain-containing protein [Xylophilus sp. Kf1]
MSAPIALDWSTPWFAPWRRPGQAAWAEVERGAAVFAALGAQAAAPRFVAADALPAHTPYESFVRETATVPTRDNLHDFFNGIAWCVYPHTKSLLNRWQAEAIARDGVQGRRGALRDAITLFDENGAVFSAPDELRAALQARDWHGLFVTRRALWSQARVWLFGHALVEKLAAPRKDITAHVLCAPAGLADPAQADAWLVRTLTEETLSAKPFSPLPVMGVPGWCDASENAGFYADRTVFRPARV